MKFQSSPLPSVSMRGRRWLVSLDAEALASLYALVLLDDEMRKMPLYGRALSRETPARLALKNSVRREIAKIKSHDPRKPQSAH